MPIYTKTGDKGITALFGGKRVPKYDLRVEAYGAVDEASSFIGFAGASLSDDEIKALLDDIQMDLYFIMGFLSGGTLKKDIIKEHIQIMEKTIDTVEKTLPKLTRFVLPQGSEAATRLHLVRVKVRMAERRVVEFVDKKKVQTENDFMSIQYLNRLSDLFFILSRRFNNGEKVT